jgi:DNA-binding HxlR family transcriptional regulator
VALLGDGKKRFSELRRTIEGISQRMLTLTLKGLERDGLITRTMYRTIPPRVEYELTKLGRSLLIPITGLGDWASQNRERIQAAREKYDQKNSKSLAISER